MENRKALNFVFLIIAVILGVTLFKQFDFKTLTFEKPWLAVVYLVAFSIAVVALVRKPKK